MRRNALFLALAGMLAGAAVGLAAGTGEAHESDPQIATVLDEVRPSLPPGVTVEVQANVSEQLVAANPTTTELVVLGAAGEPFLRISSAGVLANLASPDWYRSNDPAGAGRVPEEVRRSPTAPPRWVTVSRLDSWGWFDHRLHEQPLEVPPAVRAAGRRSTLSTWTIPMRYGDQTVTVSGHVEFRPFLGSFQVDAAPAPAGLGRDAAAGPAAGAVPQRPRRPPGDRSRP